MTRQISRTSLSTTGNTAIIAICLCCLCCLCGGASLAQATEPLRSITVAGTVETQIDPDQIVWRVRLTDSNLDMLKAKQDNDKKIDAVVALRNELKLTDGDFETGQIRIRREQEHDQRGQRTGALTYVVTREVIIRQHDLSLFDRYLDALVGSAEMEIDFSYESSRLHEVRFETRLKALKAAQDKAAAMAEVVGSQIGLAITIEEYEAERPWINSVSNNAYDLKAPGDAGDSQRFVPGSLNVKITVHATFELV